MRVCRQLCFIFLPPNENTALEEQQETGARETERERNVQMEKRKKKNAEMENIFDEHSMLPCWQGNVYRHVGTRCFLILYGN